jgi:very-short-patch-repair endonuclease
MENSEIFNILDLTSHDCMPFAKNILNKPELKEYRKSLRNHSTPAEKALWNILKNKKVKGRKFRRQYSIGNYIADF